MSVCEIANGMKRLSMMDGEIDLFEGQYPVPQGVCYNSYIIEDEKTALLDTADHRFADVWLSHVEQALAGRPVDYLIVSHVEPDHSGAMAALLARYPGLTVVGNAKTFSMLERFMPDVPIAQQRLVVCEGDTLCLGRRTLRFVMAPMVHWPEVMTTYEETERLLFSADAFGRFGDADADAPWEDEARRYYANIVGKYGAQVQALLKKAAALDIAAVCPLHGPLLRGKALERAVELYGLWSCWAPQEKGVLIAYACFHGHTAEAAEYLAACLRESGERVALVDLSRVHRSYAVGEAFRYDRIVLAATTYDGKYAPAMQAFIQSFKHKGLQNRTFALMENGSWGPLAAKLMRAELEGVKNAVVLDAQVTIHSAMDDRCREAIKALAAAISSVN